MNERRSRAFVLPMTLVLLALAAAVMVNFCTPQHHAHRSGGPRRRQFAAAMGDGEHPSGGASAGRNVARRDRAIDECADAAAEHLDHARRPQIQPRPSPTNKPRPTSTPCSPASDSRAPSRRCTKYSPSVDRIFRSTCGRSLPSTRRIPRRSPARNGSAHLHRCSNRVRQTTFSQDRPLLSSLTCFGDGRINLRRTNYQALLGLTRELLTQKQVETLLQSQRDFDVTLDQLLAPLTLTPESTAAVRAMITFKSACHGLWITTAAGNMMPASGSFATIDDAAGGNEQVVTW